MNDQVVVATQRRSPFWKRMVGVTALVATAGAAVVGVQAQGMRGHGPGGPEGLLFGGSPEHVARAVDRLLDGLNATDAQRTQIKQIATTAAADLKAQRTDARAMRQQAAQIFTAPTVDARAAETLRQQMSAERDLASKRVLQAMLDISQVLTPDQRAMIADRMQRRQAVMRDRIDRLKGNPASKPSQ